MSLQDLFTDKKRLQTKKIFTATEGVILIQVKTDGELKEHVTKVPAFLICISGEVILENERGVSEKLLMGDFVNIEPGLKHWLKGISDCNLLLIK